jgi:Zn-dependent M28 family amino/carboxypeptidase
VAATPEAQRLRAAVGATGIRRHLTEFQRIADANGGNRAAGSPGDTASADYVLAQLRAAGYAPSVQTFTVPVFQVGGAPVLIANGAPLRRGSDFDLAGYSGSGTGQARVVPVDLRLPPGQGSSTSGCEPGDFAGFPAGGVALLQRGTCTFEVKAERAQAAGAAAALIFNEGQRGRRELLRATLNGPGVRIPVFGLTYDAGAALAKGGTVRFAARTVSANKTTRNILAETPAGRAGRVVMVGAHIDSVAEGPGINDNASGSATVLELARAMAAAKPANKIRFAWWSGEELGLLGSRHYAEGLSDADAARIALYLNLDMVGSPNYSRFVYQAEGAPDGSGAVGKVLSDWFASRREAIEPVDFGPRSDHASLAARGIPVGGLFSGAESGKRRNEVEGSGGTAGRPHDACYHKACDTLDNISDRSLDELSDAAAQALATFAADTSAVDRARRG